MTSAQRIWLDHNRAWQVHQSGRAYSRIGLLSDDGRFQTVSTTSGKNSIHLLDGEILVGIPAARSAL
ncbi:MAG: hypothetical protein JXQ99_20050 [Hyphomicrobiaceae bacterium]